jgi:hypothetical protein
MNGDHSLCVVSGWGPDNESSKIPGRGFWATSSGEGEEWGLYQPKCDVCFHLLHRPRSFNYTSLSLSLSLPTSPILCISLYNLIDLRIGLYPLFAAMPICCYRNVNMPFHKHEGPGPWPRIKYFPSREANSILPTPHSYLSFCLTFTHKHTYTLPLRPCTTQCRPSFTDLP